MNYNTVYVGMDVHKESFTLCAIYGNDANFICGYEAGCLGYTLYHQLTEHEDECTDGRKYRIDDSR